MEQYCFDDYIKNNPNHKEIEFKVFKIQDKNGFRYYVKYLTIINRLFRKPLYKWETLSTLKTDSQKNDFIVKYFYTQEEAEKMVGILCQSYEQNEVVHFVKCLK